VQVIRENEMYDNGVNIQADVWDVAGDGLPPGLGESSVDIVVMIFIFSALSPSQWKKAVSNIYKVLKPGGEVLFRDYGRGDLAQVRFKRGRYLEENFYIRGDGTRVYFFGKDELVKIWSGNDRKAEEAQDENPSFEIVNLGIDRRLLVNRAKQLKMYRCWMQGRFRKQETPSPG
jgi:tRNAThr (cytosine32-N3)-methyltransferase